MSAPVFIGRMRVHFNRHGAAPLVWSVVPLGNDGEPLFEISVPHVRTNALIETVYRAKATPDDEDGKPSAWLETIGALYVNENGARIM